MIQTRTCRRCVLVASAAAAAAALLLSAFDGVAAGQTSATSRVTTTRAAKPSRRERPFRWWPTYRGMLPGLTNKQAKKLDGIASSHSRLTRGLYGELRAKKLTHKQFHQRLLGLRWEIEQAKREVLRPEQIDELSRLEIVWRMKLDAFRGIPNPYYAVQFTEEQLGLILSHRAEKHDPAVEEVNARSKSLAVEYAKAKDLAERIRAIGRMGEVENQRKDVQEKFHQFVEQLLEPDQLIGVRSRMLGRNSSVRVRIDMQGWSPLKAVKQIAESGSIKLEIEKPALKALDTKDKTVNIRSSLVTPAAAIEKVAAAFGVRVRHRGGSLVLYLPASGVSVVPSAGYRRGSIEVTSDASSRLSRWSFNVRNIIGRYTLEQLVRHIQKVSPKAKIKFDKTTSTILVTMPERDVEAVKAAVKALRQ